jgi:hypothetical protein
MSAPRSWAPKINQIRKAVDAFAQPDLSRVDVQELFAIGRSQADAIMTAAGCRVDSVGGGRLKLVSRTALLHYLKYGEAGQEADREAERRQKVAKTLVAEEEDIRFRRIAIPARPGDEWATFKGLPVRIEDGELRLKFTDRDDLLRQLYLLAKAIGNDFDGFGHLLEASGGFSGGMKSAPPEERKSA